MNWNAKIALLLASMVVTYYIELFRSGADRHNDILTLYSEWEGRGGGKKVPYQIFPVISTNLGISPQNFLTFSFSPFPTLV